MSALLSRVDLRGLMGLLLLPWGVSCGGLALPTDPDGDGVPAELGDCDNARADVYPDATEVCDGLDNNCDGVVDEGFQTTWYADGDQDGFGDPARVSQQCSSDGSLVVNALDCNDTSSAIHPGAPEICDQVDNDCQNGVDNDQDQDGALPCPQADLPADCNNADPMINPGMDEVWGDHIDQDCDGVVDADIYVSQDGSSPEPDKPRFSTIQQAILAADPGAVIAIGRGTYAERLELQGRDVSLVGMYETNRTIVDAGGLGSGLLIHRGETSATRIAHLTFINGAGTSGSVCGSGVNGSGPNGGGICVQSSSPTFEDVVLSNNLARDGGGLYITAGAPGLTNVQLLNNKAEGDGGGMYAYASSVSLESVLADGNTANQNGGGILFFTVAARKARHLILTDNQATTGAGLALRVDSDAVIEYLYAAGNVASSDAGAIWIDDSNPTLRQLWIENNRVTGTPGRGGGLYLEDTTAVLEHFLIQGNRAVLGGGMSINWGSSPTLAAGVVTGNLASQQAGGIFYYASNGVLTQAVVAGNQAGQTGGGIFFYQASGPRMDHLILMDNTMPGGVSNLTAFANTGGNPVLAYSLVYGSTGGNGVSGVSLESVKYLDPLFAQTPSTDWLDAALQLSVSSPARDLGPTGTVDPDGSLADAGAFGGPSAAGWDLDGDGLFDWWNPTTGQGSCGTDTNDRDALFGDACQTPPD